MIAIDTLLSTFDENGVPVLGGISPGIALKRCTITFKNDRDGKLIPDTGTATLEVAVPGSSGRRRYTGIPVMFAKHSDL